jgi:hypothetical protein
MKKIFTLIFSMGLLTLAFAQGGRHHRDYNSNGGFQSQSYGYQDHQPYGNGQIYQVSPYYNQDNWGNERRDGDRYDNDGDRNDMRGWSYDRGYGDNFDRRMYHHFHEQHWRRSRVSISFGF